MSADNWTVCPKCHEQYVKRLEEFDRKMRDSYGKVSPEEYIRLLGENERLQSQEEPETLKENYGQGIVDGGYYLRYNGGCTECGWHYTKEIDEKVYP